MLKGLFIWEARRDVCRTERFPGRDVWRDGTFAGTERFPGRDVWRGRDVCRDRTFAETGRLPERDVKGNLAMHVYISYLSHSVYMERFFPGRFSSRPGKAGSRFAQPGSTTASDWPVDNRKCVFIQGQPCSCFWQVFSAEIEWVKLNLVISEANWINKLD